MKSGCGLQHLARMRAGGGRVAHLRRGRRHEGVVRVVRLGDAAEGLQRIGIVPRRELRAPEMVPEALGMIRVEPHRLADPFDAFLRPSEPGQQLALLHDDEVAVRIEAERALLMIGRLVEFVVS